MYFAAASITLALGLAATTSIFSLVSMILLRPLNVRNPGEIVALGQASRIIGSSPSLSYPTVRDINALNDVFAGAIGYANETVRA